MKYFKPYEGPWTKSETAHLLRRAGFGGLPDEINTLEQLSVDNAISYVLDYPEKDEAYEEHFASLRRYGYLQGVLLPDELKDVQAWWLYRMRHATHPLQEQLTLFWHDHFVSDWQTVYDEIPERVNNGNDGSVINQQCSRGTLGEDPERREKMTVRLLQEQNHLFREQGFKGFRDLLLNVTRNPAMLIYLDNHLNTARAPQENYARELMELFSMGEGNYTEEDVREIARALTGETINKRCLSDWPYSYRHNRGTHDREDKTVFGVTFNHTRDIGMDTEVVIDLIMHQVSQSGISPAHDRLPATAVYMSWKFINWFVHDEIPIAHPAVEELAEIFYENQPNGYRYDVRELLRIIFSSEFFFASEYRYTMVKHPADYVVTMLRTLELDEYSYHDGAALMMREMGMSLFSPPNVAGWNHGKSWINSGSILARFNYADYVSSSRFMNRRYCETLLDNGVFADENDHDTMINYYTTRLLQDGITEEEYRILNDFLRRILSGRDIFYRKIRGLVYLIMTMPKYQLK